MKACSGASLVYYATVWLIAITKIDVTAKPISVALLLAVSVWRAHDKEPPVL